MSTPQDDRPVAKLNPKRSQDSGSTTIRVQGLPGSPGFAVGRVHRITAEPRRIPRRTIGANQVKGEIERFNAAVAAAIGHLDGVMAKLQSGEPEGLMILEAHRLMLQDPMLIERTHDRVEQSRVNAEAALAETGEQLEAAFSRLEDSYLRERGRDLRFVVERIMAHLTGDKAVPVNDIPAGAIVVAHDLSPADTMVLTGRRIGAFVVEVGGLASHITIMARAMEIPAVVGAPGVVKLVADEHWIAVDGSEGYALIDPDRNTLNQFRERQRRYRAREVALLANRDRPAVTLDGIRVKLEGNIEYAQEIESLLSHGGEGIGLFRTEYLFLSGDQTPDEEAQFQLYRRIVEEVSPNSVTMRTLDIGGDKAAPRLTAGTDGDNPALGLRGIRFTLKRPDLLLQQLRALLRASAYGPIRIMFPMITTLEELLAVLKLLESAREKLRRDDFPMSDDIPIGVMIETPSSVLIGDHLAEHVDFFSIGTNDLVQYALAVDRNNENVANLFQPMHPAVLQLIHLSAQAAQKADIGLSMCGEMAGELRATPLLIGCGLKRFSMNPISIPFVKDLINRISSTDCEVLLAEALRAGTAAAVEMLVDTFFEKIGFSPKSAA